MPPLACRLNISLFSLILFIGIEKHKASSLLPLLLFLIFMNVTLINDFLICIFRFVPPSQLNENIFFLQDASTLFWFLFVMLPFLLLFADYGRTILYGNCFEPEIKSTSINHFFVFFFNVFVWWKLLWMKWPEECNQKFVPCRGNTLRIKFREL